MTKKKDTEIQIIDTPEGVELVVGKKTIAEIIEQENKFLIRENGKDRGLYRSYSLALEEAIKSYNLSL